MMFALSTVGVAALSMTVLGLLFGAGLLAAARALSSGEDPRVARALDLLPGVNCAACGYAGCRAYAEAVVAGQAVNLCLPGGPSVAAALAELMGVELGEMVARRAVVHCQGGRAECPDRFRYVGEPDCLAAHLTSGGPKACLYGCLGLGSCARACPFGAIVIDDNALPVIDESKCTACGICVDTCPRHLISLLPQQYRTYLGCSSHHRGKVVKDICSVGCIACGLCAKRDPAGSITMADNLPVLDFEKADGDFTVAADVCPAHCFVLAASPARVDALTAAGAAGA
jgi:electron transport complex protein RnfB